MLNTQEQSDVYIVGGKRQIKYKFIPTSLFRDCPLIRGLNESNLYHRLYTIQSNLCSAKLNNLVVAWEGFVSVAARRHEFITFV